MHRSIAGFLAAALCLVCGSVTADPPHIAIDRLGGLARITATSENGVDVEVNSDLAPGGWESIIGLGASSQTWLDAESALLSQRCYRLNYTDVPVPRAADFRLMDHQGKTRHLYYHFNDPRYLAAALIFTQNGCAKIRDMIPTIRSLTNRFPNVLFWLVDSNPADNRSNILAEAVSLGISNGPPILYDAAQLVGQAYGAAKTPDAVAIDTSTFQVFYRGAIDDRLGASAVGTTQHYLSNALVNFLGGNSISLIRSRATGCDLSYQPPFPTISYSTEIAPLLQAKCVRCHSPGNIAPWAMTNYDIVTNFASQIKNEVMAGRMPPWHADPIYQVFTNDASLSPQEQRKLVQWIDDGAARGTGSDPLATAPAVTNYPSTWPIELGPPAATVSIPQQSIPASGDVAYRTFSVTTPFSTDVWLRAAVVLPGNLRVVHHCLVYNSGSSQLGGLDGFFAAYVPGNQGGPFPPGSGKLLRAGEQVNFQMHYVTTGTADTDRTQLGFYIAPAPPTYRLQTKSAFNPSFSPLSSFPIPAGNRDFETTAQYPTSGTLTTNILVFEMSPHMHFRGSRFKYEAIYPNGSREVLLSVPNYVFNWQRVYRLSQPKLLPRGSRILCTGAWDNSAQNRFNPNPNTAVYWGDQTYEEMFIGYFNYAEVP